ncbi:MAG: hypothetical protein K0S41_1638 [Anaerocolumna sp.]|jgi:hypothetical protein|nr:hypothetical protein [Anaerocolumna sp.]
MKKNDIILVAIILVIAAAGLLYVNLNKKGGDLVIVRVDGKVVEELPLNKDTTQIIEGVGGTNKLIIEDGHADVIEASCPDALCVHQRQIEHDGETIVCLPNKVVVEIQSDKKNEVDAVVN